MSVSDDDVFFHGDSDESSEEIPLQEYRRKLDRLAAQQAKVEEEFCSRKELFDIARKYKALDNPPEPHISTSWRIGDRTPKILKKKFDEQGLGTPYLPIVFITDGFIKFTKEENEIILPYDLSIVYCKKRFLEYEVEYEVIAQQII